LPSTPFPGGEGDRQRGNARLREAQREWGRGGGRGETKTRDWDREGARVKGREKATSGEVVRD
jgi:hypothetical protein